MRDVNYAIRMLWKRPGFTIVAVVTLALGIGANTAVFSVINAVLLAPLPYEEPERLVAVWNRQPTNNLTQQPVALADLQDWQESNQAFEQLAASRGVTFNLTQAGETERVTGARVSGNFYILLRVKPVVGRVFLTEEDKPGAAPVALISYNLWQRRYAADPQLVGKTIQLDSSPYTVVGVLPPTLTYPTADTDLVVPLVPQPRELARANHFVRVLGRLRPGASLAQAQAELDTICARLEQQYPVTNAGFRAQLVPLQEQLVGGARAALLVLLGAVGCVLLIACANVANLLLVRAVTRQTEFAVRMALGASRWQLVRQLLTESLLLSLCGGALGLLLALWGVHILVRLSAGSIPRSEEISLSYRVLGFTVLLSLLTGVVFGLLPALRSAGGQLTEALKAGRRGATEGLLNKRLLNLLVVAEVALAMVLLVGAGLMLRSFILLRQVSPGYDQQSVLTAGVGLSQAKFPELRQQARFYQDLLARLRTLPGISSVAIVSKMPVTGFATSNFNIQGQPVKPEHQPDANYRVISDNYFQTMGLPLLAGRDFTVRDANDTPDVVIINQALADRYWPSNESPVGKRVQLPDEQDRWREIVGVVGNEKLSGLDMAAGPALYVPLPQNTFPNALRSVVIVARAPGELMSIVPSMQRELRALDSEQTLFQARPLRDVLANSLAQRRFNSLLLIIFAALAGGLAAVGIYGVIAYTVTQRTHEIGVRLALGAQRLDVLRLILGQGIKLTLGGIAIGLCAAFALTRVLASLLYNISPTDPATFLGIALLLTAVALLASYLPAYRATKVDPCIALRAE